MGIKCVGRERNKRGLTIKYKLLNDWGQIIEMTPDELREGLKTNKVYVENLKLTANDRIIEVKNTGGKRETGYSYHSTIGDVVLYPSIAIYGNGVLCLNFEYDDPESGEREFFCRATVNIRSLPYLHSALDTNNNGDKIVDFLEMNGFGKAIGVSLESGFCVYPVFKFNKAKLRSIDPDTFAKYESNFM